MKINYTKKFSKLPTLIEDCSSPVYMVFPNDHKVAVNSNPEVFDFFKGTCESMSGNLELHLEFADPHDMSSILNYLVCA